MLAKKYRLSVASTFNKKGEVHRGRYFLFKVLPTTRVYPQVAVVVGVAVDSRASARNKIKRALYEQFRESLPKLKNANYCIIVSPTAGKADLYAIISELSDGLNKFAFKK